MGLGSKWVGTTGGRFLSGHHLGGSRQTIWDDLALSRMAIDFWRQTGAPKEKIVPMAGELAHSTAADIDAYAKEAKAQGISSLHFYTYEDGVKESVWNAVARA
jgi:hypothetical protein